MAAAGSDYKPVYPAPAGKYAINLEPLGKGLADFYSLDVVVEDKSGNRYSEDFYTVTETADLSPSTEEL